MKKQIFLLCALWILGCSYYKTWAQTAQSIGGWQTLVNGPNVVTSDDNYVYIGGSFWENALYKPGVRGIKGEGAVIAPTGRGNAVQGFPEVGDGVIYTAISDGAGGWYIGGTFTIVGGVTRNGLARINADKTLDASWNPDSGGLVRFLMLSGTDVYIGGDFTSIGGQTRNRLAKVNATTGALDATWNPNAGGSVNVLAISGTSIFVGGSFTTINGATTRNRIAKLNTTDGTADATWNPNSTGSVKCLLMSGTDLFVGGQYAGIGGLTRKSIAKLSTTGTGAADGTWNPSSSTGIVDILNMVSDGTNLYVAGVYATMGGQTRNGLSKLSITGTGAANATWNPDIVSGSAKAMVLNGTDLYLCGNINTIGGQPRKHLAKVSTTGAGALDATWKPTMTGTALNIMAFSSGKLYVGGDCYGFDGESGGYVARFDKTTLALDTVWRPTPGGASSVNAIAISGADIYVSGSFTSIGGQTRNRIAKLNNTDGAADATWNPDANNSVTNIAISGANIYVAGLFTSIGGQTLSRIAKLNNTNGAANATWNPNANNSINSIAISGADVYVSGSFTSIGGQTRNRIAKLNNTDGAADATWNPNANNTVSTITISGADMYVGGDFTSIGGQTRSRIAKLNNTDGAADATWNPNASNSVYSIAASGSDMYVGGFFATIGGQSQSRLAKLSTGTGVADASWSANCDNSVSRVHLSGEKLFVVGQFTTIGGQAIPKMAQVSAPSCGVVTVSPNSLSAGTQGAAYNTTITQSGLSSATFSISSGSLPTGISLSSGGVLSGTPSVNGTFNFTVQASEGACSGSKAYSLEISSCTNPVFTLSSTANAVCMGSSTNISTLINNTPNTIAYNNGGLVSDTMGKSLTLGGQLSGSLSANIVNIDLACSALTAGSLTGKIALTLRGTCSFATKAKNAQDAGAAAVVIVNNVPATSPPSIGGTDASVTIPVYSVTKEFGDALIAVMTPTTQATLTPSERYTYVWNTGETTQSINTGNLASAQKFKVTVSNAYGCSKSDSVTINVNAATAIGTQPQAQTVTAGVNVTFTVAASGDGLSYQWKKGAANVGTNSNTLVLNNVNASEAGNYSVEITGTCGNVTSNSVTLAVNSTGSAGNCTNPALTIVNIGASVVDISWTPEPTNSIGYEVQWRTGTNPWNGPGRFATSLAAYRIPSLVPNSTYTVRFRSICTSGTNAWDNYTVTTEPLFTCNAPTVTVNNISASIVDISWGAEGNTAGYEVQWQTGTNPWTGPGKFATSVTSYRIPSLLPNTTYNYRVRSLCTPLNEWTLWTTSSFTTAAIFNCNAPTPTLAHVGSTVVDVSWGLESNAAAYEIQWQTVGGFWTGPGRFAGNVTSYRIPDLLPNTTYNYRVRSLCSPLNELTLWVIGSFTTKSSTNCSSPIVSDTATATAIDLSWTATDSTNAYEIQWQSVGGLWNGSGRINNPLLASFRIPNLLASTTYNYRVRSRCLPTNEWAAWSTGNITTTGAGGGRLGVSALAIHVYPNPSSGLVNVSGVEKASYAVFNTLGQQVLAGELNSENTALDLSNQANGMYLLKVVSDGAVQTKQVIINR